jgi:hypothetical protein
MKIADAIYRQRFNNFERLQKLNNQDIVNDKLILQQCPDNTHTDSRTNLGSTTPLLSKPFEVFEYAVLNL